MQAREQNTNKRIFLPNRNKMPTGRTRRHAFLTSDGDTFYSYPVPVSDSMCESSMKRAQDDFLVMDFGLPTFCREGTCSTRRPASRLLVSAPSTLPDRPPNSSLNDFSFFNCSDHFTPAPTNRNIRFASFFHLSQKQPSGMEAPPF